MVTTFNLKSETLRPQENRNIFNTEWLNNISCLWNAFTLLQAKCNAVFLSASCSAKSALATLAITSVTQHNSGD